MQKQKLTNGAGLGIRRVCPRRNCLLLRAARTASMAATCSLSRSSSIVAAVHRPRALSAARTRAATSSFGSSWFGAGGSAPAEEGVPEEEGAVEADEEDIPKDCGELGAATAAPPPCAMIHSRGPVDATLQKTPCKDHQEDANRTRVTRRKEGG